MSGCGKPHFLYQPLFSVFIRLILPEMWFNFRCGLLFDGAFDDRLSGLSGRILYQIEVTRNNEVTTYIDTFFLQPGIMNEVFIEY